MRLLKYLRCLIPILLASNSFSQGSPQPGASIRKPLIYQFGQNVHINAGGQRPLLQAIDALQEKYGWTVDYEDPQYPPAVDGPTPPAIGPVRRHLNGRNNGSAGFSVEFNVTPDSRPDEQAVLAVIVDANNQSNDGGQFELRKDNVGSFMVVGEGALTPQRETSSKRPILDSLITLTAERRRARETIALICQKVSQQSRIRITLNDAVRSFPGSGTAVVGGTEVQARTLLSQTLASMGGNFFWRLLYDSNTKSYELSINRRP